MTSLTASQTIGRPRWQATLAAASVSMLLPTAACAGQPVVEIDRQHLHKRADGSAVEFVGFPAGTGTSPGVKGIRSVQDVKAVLAARLAR